MATRKRWSRTVGTRRGNRIRIYQRSSSGNLQMAVWDPEKRRYKQVSLGHTDRERATREAAEMVRLPPVVEPTPDRSGPAQPLAGWRSGGRAVEAPWCHESRRS